MNPELGKGIYYEFPDRKFLAGLKTKDDLKFLELSKIYTARKCKGPGIFVPKFELSSDDQNGVTVVDRGFANLHLREEAVIPDQGVTHIILRHNSSYVTELNLLS